MTAEHIAFRQAIPMGWLDRTIAPGIPRLLPSWSVADSAFLAVQQPAARKRSWIGRHPVLFGALWVSAAAIFYGSLWGDAGYGQDLGAAENGFVNGTMGGMGDALVGAIVGAVTK